MLRPRKPDTERIVYLGDIHIPFHDPVAVDLMLGFISWFKPHRVYLIGDIADFYQVSHYDKDPNRLTQLQEDLDACAAFLRILRNLCPKAKFWFREGNHEHRLTRYLWSHPQIAKLRSLRLPELLHLKDLGIAHAAYGEDLRLKDFLIEHGDVVRKHAGATARAMLEKRGMSGISGHTHRMSAYCATDESGDKAWYENGCLCSLRVDYIIGKPNWQQGFSVMHRWENRWEMEQVRIINQRLYYHGFLWDAKARGA